MKEIDKIMLSLKRVTDDELAKIRRDTENIGYVKPSDITSLLNEIALLRIELAAAHALTAIEEAKSNMQVYSTFTKEFFDFIRDAAGVDMSDKIKDKLNDKG